jgi:hypothetical protein
MEEYSASVFKVIYIEHGGNSLLQNVGYHLRDYTFPVENEEIHENLSQDRRCPDKAPPECKSRTLQLDDFSVLLLLLLFGVVLTHK